MKKKMTMPTTGVDVNEGRFTFTMTVSSCVNLKRFIEQGYGASVISFSRRCSLIITNEHMNILLTIIVKIFFLMK
jgi:hypothetical protein